MTDKKQQRTDRVAELKTRYKSMTKDQLMEGLANASIEIAFLESEPVGTIEAILAERQGQYGTFADVAAISQDIQSSLGLAAVRSGARGKMEADQPEAIQVICSKLSRIVNGDPNHIDSWDDIGGYSKLVADRLRDARRRS